MAESSIKGGDKLEKTLAKMSRNLSSGASVKVGFLTGATYPNGTPVAMVAAIQNFGAPRAKIPPRPFFSNMVRDKQAEWPSAIAGLLTANDFDAAAALEQTGQAIAGQLRQSIVDTNEPPLSPVTLRLREMKRANPDLVVTGKTVGDAKRSLVSNPKINLSETGRKPLVDTGFMLNSVDYVVTRK